MHTSTLSAQENHGGDVSTAELSRLLADIRLRAEEFERQKFISADVIEKFRSLGVYRAFVPKKYGGMEMPPGGFCALIERIAAADGSAGWVASFGMNPFYLGGLPSAVLDRVWQSGPDVVFAAGLFPSCPAAVEPGGFRISGRWSFASGCMGADLIGVGIQPTGAQATALPRVAVLPAAQVTIDPVWNSVGLAGTGSHDLTLDNAFVPEEWTLIRGGALNLEGVLYRYPALSLATQVLAVVSAGIARAAIDEILAIAERQRSVTGAPLLADRQFAQIAVARAEAGLASARCWFYDAIEQVWQVLCRGDEPASPQVSALRLSSTHLTRTAAKVASAMLALSGMGGIAMRSPLQRYVRDTLVITQHAFMGELTLINAGQMLFGRAPLPGYL